VTFEVEQWNRAALAVNGLEPLETDVHSLMMQAADVLGNFHHPLNAEGRPIVQRDNPVIGIRGLALCEIGAGVAAYVGTIIVNEVRRLNDVTVPKETSFDTRRDRKRSVNRDQSWNLSALEQFGGERSFRYRNRWPEVEALIQSEWKGMLPGAEHSEVLADFMRGYVAQSVVIGYEMSDTARAVRSAESAWSRNRYKKARDATERLHHERAELAHAINYRSRENIRPPDDDQLSKVVADMSLALVNVHSLGPWWVARSQAVLLSLLTGVSCVDPLDVIQGQCPPELVHDQGKLWMHDVGLVPKDLFDMFQRCAKGAPLFKDFGAIAALDRRLQEVERLADIRDWTCWFDIDDPKNGMSLLTAQGRPVDTRAQVVRGYAASLYGEQWPVRETELQSRLAVDRQMHQWPPRF
jgi:hypothetical protein